MTIRTKPSGRERRTYRARSLRYHMALVHMLRDRQWAAARVIDAAYLKHHITPFAKRRKA